VRRWPGPAGALAAFSGWGRCGRLALRSGRWHSLRLELRGRCTAMAAFEYLASPTAGRQRACASPRWSWAAIRCRPSG
jgi:hypothetical protein